jgi:hypothetical protein
MQAAQDQMQWPDALPTVWSPEFHSLLKTLWLALIFLQRYRRRRHNHMTLNAKQAIPAQDQMQWPDALPTVWSPEFGM